MEGQVFLSPQAPWPKRVKIAASVLAADFGRMRECCEEAQAAGVDLLHFDVMDGHFVPPITFGSAMVRAIRNSCTIPLDVHLMVEEPARFIPEFIDAGANIITVHAEASTHLYRDVETIKKAGALASVALNPATPACLVQEILGDLDMVLCMTVEPGYGGQAFLPFVLNKVSAIARLLEDRGLAAEIEVDGGVNGNTASSCVEAGATVLVAGTAIFSKPDLKSAVDELRRLTRL